MISDLQLRGEASLAESFLAPNSEVRCKWKRYAQAVSRVGNETLSYGNLFMGKACNLVTTILEFKAVNQEQLSS